MKLKKWLVEAHGEYQEKEASIDGDLKSALAEHQKTYLYGLGLKVKTLTQEDDLAAALLIQREINKVNEDPDYFPVLMQGNDGR